MNKTAKKISENFNTKSLEIIIKNPIDAIFVIEMDKKKSRIEITGHYEDNDDHFGFLIIQKVVEIIAESHLENVQSVVETELIKLRIKDAVEYGLTAALSKTVLCNEK